MKTTLASLLLALLLATIPTRADACSGLLDCAFGWTDRTEVRAQRDMEIARIEAQEAERIRQADAEVERIRQQQYATESQRDIAIAQAEQQAQQYKTMIQALTDEKIAGINSNADSQIAALQAQAQIATAGILETGRTERYRIVGGWAFAIVALALVGLLVALYMRRQPQQPVMMVGQRQPNAALPWYSDSIEIVEVKHANRVTKR